MWWVSLMWQLAKSIPRPRGRPSRDTITWPDKPVDDPVTRSARAAATSSGRSIRLVPRGLGVPVTWGAKHET